MDNREYKTHQEFASDVRLMFDNCYQYNHPGEDIIDMAKKLQDVFEMRYAEIPHESDSETFSASSASEEEEVDTSDEERSQKLAALKQEVN